MDVLFSVVVTKGCITHVDPQIHIDVDNTMLYVPVIHDSGISSKKDLEKLRQELHGRIDNIFDLALLDIKKPSKKKKGKTTYKVFDCFGSEPRLIDVELDDE